MRLFPPIKPDVVGYLDMKGAHKKHISQGYGFQFCVLLQAVWKSFWYLAFKDFLHIDEKEPKEKFLVLLNVMKLWHKLLINKQTQEYWY